MLLAPQITLQAFDTWAVEFVGPIIPPGKRTGMHYIITATYYLTIWDEAMLVKYCTDATATKFLFENVVNIFCYPKILLSDQGINFVKKMIVELTA